jgi:hypothetical protein
MKNIVSIFIFYIGFQFSMVAQSTCVSIGFQSKTETTATFSCTLTNNGSPAAAVADYTIIVSANGASLDARSGSSTVSMPSSLGSFTVPIASGATEVNFSLSTGEVTSTTDVIPVSICNSTVSIAVLPVELLTFMGYNKGGVNVLNWATASEVNNKGFQVERLNPEHLGGNVWDILGFVNAKSKGSSYDFTDNTPLSTSYYRLRQLDNDGKETYSKVISVSLKGSDKLKVYPNPVSDLLIVETDIKDDYQILNLLGQQVMNGKATQRIDVSTLPEGTYFLKVGTEQMKFVKY